MQRSLKLAELAVIWLGLRKRDKLRIDDRSGYICVYTKRFNCFGMILSKNNFDVRTIFYGMCLILSACAPSESVEELPVVNLDAADTRELNLSTLVDEVRVIPLETSEKYLISYPQACFADDFVLVGSFQVGSPRKPGRLFRFDLNGKFINEIGAGTGGKGPGEHMGEPLAIRYYEDEQLIQVNWGGKWRDPQLFNLAGDFVRDIHVPDSGSMGLQFVERWNDSTWFGSAFGIVGPNDFSPGDSNLVHFFTNDGRDVSDIPRLIFAARKHSIGLPPAPVHYKKNGRWKFFVTGLDTLFRIEDMRLVPEVVLQSEKYVNYNTVTKQEEFDRKALILSIAEGKDYWLLVRQILRIPLSVGHNFEVPFVFIDKNSMQATNIRLQDDVFGLLSGTFFGENLNWPDGQKPFQHNLLYTIVNADELVELLKNRSGEVTSEAQIELNKLENLQEDDNSVIFLFTLKDSIKLQL